MKITEHKLDTDPGDRWNLQIKESPNSSPGLAPGRILLAATNIVGMKHAVQKFEDLGASPYHLVLGKNGQDLVQLVPFSHQAAGAGAETIAIALDYSTAKKEGPDAEFVIGIAGNNKRVRVPAFPTGQLDSLLELVAFLCETYQVSTLDVLTELDPADSIPGPAFPLTSFREKLFEKTNGITGGLIVLEELAEDTDLYHAPEHPPIAITEMPLKAGTRVSINQDSTAWVRVEVIPQNEKDPWLMGWVEGRKVQTQVYTPEIRGQFLFTTDGRRYRYIPADPKNYDHDHKMPPEAVDFIVMHITTGIFIQSTLNTFKNPSNEVSAHLVIGRDGRIVQMVPFDHAAYHAGRGSWENKGQINWRSIGIEVDNAGKLSESKDKTKVYRKKTDTTIPPSDYVRVQHWRDFAVRPWHAVPDIQRDVTFKVVKALEEHFRPLLELLEHERISLLTRTDPGPAFPMDDLRIEVMQSKELQFKRHPLLRDTTLYENTRNAAPLDPHPQWPNIKRNAKCRVEILEIGAKNWQKIRILKHKKNSWKGREGWVRGAFRGVVGSTQDVTRDIQFYKKPGPPSLPTKITLPKNSVVRIQRIDKKWCHVAAPKHVIGAPFKEGWVRTKDVDVQF